MSLPTIGALGHHWATSQECRSREHISLLETWLEPAALSLAVISFSITFINSSRFHASSLTCRLTINLNSCGNLFIRTEVSKLPYDSAETPNDFRPLTCDSTHHINDGSPSSYTEKSQFLDSTGRPYAS